jgi:hypothetical protein
MANFEAKKVTSHTLVGVYGEPPHSRGNCFSVSDGKREWRIINFNLENLEALQEAGLQFPIHCKSLDDYCAIVQDGRIGERWYSGHYCEVCCPESLLPKTQLDRHERDELRGIRFKHGNCVTIMFDKTVEFP